MKFVPRKQINCEKWDLLVDSTPNSTIYNKSFFLDIVCEDWCIYIDQAYTVGIAIPFTKNLNLRIAYTPNFVRSLDFLGNCDEGLKHKMIEGIKKEFKIGNFSISEFNLVDRVYQQIIPSQEYVKNALAKRMIKKFEQSKLKIREQNNFDELLSFIEICLFQRLKDLTKKDFQIFSNLIITLYEQKMLTAFSVIDEQGKLVGCSFFVTYNQRMTYIKGVATKDAMDLGVMYGLLNHAILLARQRNLLFDFGGSNISSIRRFFCNLGGQDCSYQSIEWGSEPYYYKLAKGIYRKLNRRN